MVNTVGGFHHRRIIARLKININMKYICMGVGTAVIRLTHGCQQEIQQQELFTNEGINTQSMTIPSQTGEINQNSPRLVIINRAFLAFHILSV